MMKTTEGSTSTDMQDLICVYYHRGDWHLRFGDGSGMLLYGLPAQPADSQLWFAIGHACAIREDARYENVVIERQLKIAGEDI